MLVRVHFHDMCLFFSLRHSGALQGDVNISQPWAVQIEARSKYDAWEANKGKSQDEAKAQYINLANEAAKTYGVKA